MLSIKEIVYCNAPVGLFSVVRVFWIIQCRISQISLLLVLKETEEYYTGVHRRNGPNFGRVFLMLNYTNITQNTYIQS